jgi:tetratricopeptide (TPR) repeat protein
VVAGTLIFGAARTLQARHSPCEGGAAKLSGVWEPGQIESARKTTIHSAFAATGKGYAERAFATAKQALDQYTAQWTATYTDACEATAVRGEQSPEVLDLRMSCLQGRLDSVKALTDVFSHADGSTVENAASAVAGLGDLERCSDLTVLRAVVKPPDDPMTRKRVQSLAPRLARIKALTDAGHFAEARMLAKPVVVEARATGYLPITGLALYRLAELSASDPGEMSALYEESIWAAQSGGDDELVAEASLSQSYAVGYMQSDTKRARLWLQLCQATLGRLRGHELMRAWVVNNEALMAEADGRYEEAASLNRRALEIKEKLLGPQNPDVATSVGNLSNVLAKLGRVDEALDSSQRALKIHENALGAEHPQVGMDLIMRAEQLLTAKRPTEAEQDARRAVHLLEPELGATNPVLAAALSILGRTLLDVGRRQDARPFLERAYASRTQTEKDPGRRAESAFLLAQALWPSRTERSKALTLALEAQRDYAKSTDKQALSGVERWLQEHHAL